MQVDVFLDAPVALAQFARHIRTQARSAVAQRLVGVQQGLHVELVRQRLAHHRVLVELPLSRLGRHRRGRMDHPTLVGQGPHRTDRQLEQALFAVHAQRVQALGLARRSLGGRPLGNHLLQRLEVGEGAHFHGGAILAQGA